MQTLLRTDDARTFSKNERGVLTEEQRTLFRPDQLFLRSVSRAILAAPIIAFVAAQLVFAAAVDRGFAFWWIPAVGLALLIALAFPLLVLAAQRRAAIQRDLASGIIRTADGMVTLGRHGYTARTLEGTPLRRFQGTLLPGPGRYTFAYLAESRILLSASPAGDEAMHDTESTRTLQPLLRSDPEMLALNRHGIAAPAQIAAAVHRARLLGGLFAFGIIASILSILIDSGRGVAGWYALPVGIGWVLLCAYVAQLLFHRKIAGGRVEIFEGPIRLFQDGKRPTLEISGVRFVVDYGLYQAIPPSGRYRAFRLHGTQELLNLEAIEDSPDTNNAHSVEPEGE